MYDGLKENEIWNRNGKKQQKKYTKTNLLSFVQFQVFTIVPWCDVPCMSGSVYVYCIYLYCICAKGHGILTGVLVLYINVYKRSPNVPRYIVSLAIETKKLF